MDRYEEARLDNEVRAEALRRIDQLFGDLDARWEKIKSSDFNLTFEGELSEKDVPKYVKIGGKNFEISADGIRDMKTKYVMDFTTFKELFIAAKTKGYL